ncbi:MAG: DNA polymerase IV, partial [Nitrospirota bacterium]
MKNDRPLTISSWPKAILHLDADAFFASCEQAIHPELKGRPVITGKERGIVAAASYEAKAKGIQRGTRLFEVKKICPDAVILPSDYETYSLFSIRMFNILRRF